MVDALVLSGGASHGDFEVGAVRRLFEAGFQPALIVAASVGSINAVKLCEMGALAAADAPSGLEQIWLGLHANSYMYTKNPDFDLSALDPIANQLKSIGLNLQADYTWRLFTNVGIGLQAGTLVAGPSGSLVGLAAGLITSIFQSGNDFSALAAAAQTLMDALNKIEQAQSIYTLGPIHDKLFDPTVLDPNKVAASQIRLLMAVVSLESGDLRYITGGGAVMHEDTSTPYSEQLTVNQICQSDLDAYNTAVADLRATEASRGDYTFAGWHAAVLNADAAVATAKAGLDACRRANPGPVTQPVSTDVRTGVLASASIPMIFKPVKIGNDNYVDGGTRNQVPITAAIAAGATTIWAIDCSHPAVGPAVDPLSNPPQLIGSFDTANFIEIANRAAADIMPYQIQLDNDAAADTRSATVTLVRPEAKDIHNGFTIDPGLILINMARGYMRTDDVMLAQFVYGDTTPGSINAISAALHTTDITNQRYQIWVREHAVVGWTLNMEPDETVQTPTAPATPTVDQKAFADVRQMKKQLQQLVAARVNGVDLNGSPIILNGKPLITLFGASSPGGRIPEQPIPANTWWLQWEAHQLGIDPGSAIPPIPPHEVAFSAVAPQLWDNNTPFTPLPLISRSLLEFIPDNRGGRIWNAYDQTVSTGAQVTGDPAVYTPLNGGAPHIYVRGTNNNLLEFIPDNVGGHIWNAYDLTQASNGPQVAGDPAVYTPLDGGAPHIYVRATSNDLIEFIPDNRGGRIWNAYDLTQASNGPQVAGDPAVYTPLDGGAPHIYVRGTNNNLLEFIPDNRGGRIWNAYDQTVSTGAQVTGDPAVYTPLNRGAPHIYIESSRVLTVV